MADDPSEAAMRVAEAVMEHIEYYQDLAYTSLGIEPENIARIIDQGMGVAKRRACSHENKSAADHGYEPSWCNDCESWVA